MFEWDDNKNQKNIEKHGISFEIAIEIFNDKVMHETDKEVNGEVRTVAIGQISDIVVTVVYTYRNNRHRLISARRASKAERMIYYGKK